MSVKWITEKYPLHIHVWNNDYDELERVLGSNAPINIELLDPRGRTPLHLAVTLGHLESVRVLLRHQASANAENSKYWTAVQEAVSTGDPELVQLVLQHRDQQRHTGRTEGVPALLQRLQEAPDFYVEMKWEFTSWVPLVSRMCPSDTYKVWKSGSNVRIDTTLLGFDNMNWQRGSRSYIFKGEVNSATVLEIDHDARQVYSEVMRVMPQPPDVSMLSPSDDAVAARLTSPIVTTYIDTEKISFERSKTGIWGWRNDRTENINSYDCKVFCASNVELVTKTRTEHLTEQEKRQSKKTARSPIESFLGMAEQQEKAQAQGAIANGDVSMLNNNPSDIKPEEYFDATFNLEGKDIGRPLEQTAKVQKFKATLWLCEDYPLSLPQQVVPIIDLMAASNAHFRKLKDFITLQLPSGFPTKIEIPLFHVLNARITFGNIYALDSPVPGVNRLQDPDGKLECVLDESVFSIPTSYSTSGDVHHERLRDEDDQLLQFAIQQSLIEAGTEEDQVTLWEALNKTKSLSFPEMQSQEERMLQRALEESMNLNPNANIPTLSLPERPVIEHPQCSSPPNLDNQLQLALEISQREQDDAARRRQTEEDELEMILKLSLTEK